MLRLFFSHYCHNKTNIWWNNFYPDVKLHENSTLKPLHIPAGVLMLTV